MTTLCNRIDKQIKPAPSNDDENSDVSPTSKPATDEAPKKDKIICCRYGIPILLLA